MFSWDFRSALLLDDTPEMAAYKQIAWREFNVLSYHEWHGEPQYHQDRINFIDELVAQPQTDKKLKWAIDYWARSFRDEAVKSYEKAKVLKRISQ